MTIQEEYELNIYIDGLNVFDAPGVMLLDAEIAEAISDPVPTCLLKLSIPIGWLDERSIADGTQIRFELKNKEQNINEDLKFRLFNIDKININEKFVKVAMEGLLDFYEGYTQGNIYNLYGNSSDVFKSIANHNNLNSEIDDTNDTQLWIAGENNVYQFMTDMCTHGWIDDTSAMFWCMDRHGILLYKNLTSLFRKRSKNIGVFIQLPHTDAKEKVYGYSRSDVSIQSGYENIVNGGYGGDDQYFDLLSYSWKNVTAKKIVAESNLINISKELSRGLAESWYPFDVGNFHPNYHKAKKQNGRILSTYSTYVNLACQYFTPFRLGQIVNFVHTDEQDIDNKIQLTSGTFCICAIKIKLNTKAITCNLQLMMQGLNGRVTTREVY